MQFFYSMPFHSSPPNPEFLSQQAVMELAVTAEEAGFAAASFTDHPAPTDTWRSAGGHDSLDPFIGLAYVAAATTRLRLLTHLIVLPYRNPLLVAKSVATIDQLSGGRLMLGLGVGYQEAEFTALGVEHAKRNEIFDESIEVMKLAWTGETISHHGKHFTAEGVTSLPRPLQQPHPQLWIGGNAKITLRRIAQYATGWMVLPSTAGEARVRQTVPLNLDTLPATIAELKAMAEAAGRTDPIQIDYPVSDWNGVDPSKTLETVHRLDRMGVQWCSWGGRAKTLPALKDEIHDFGERVIRPFT